MSKTANVDLYGNAYGHFATSVLEEVRLETYGEDIGQSGWMTADEYRRFFELLELDAESNVVDICSGSGGPAIFMAQTTGCHVLGLDINEEVAAKYPLGQIRGGGPYGTDRSLDGTVVKP